MAKHCMCSNVGAASRDIPGGAGELVGCAKASAVSEFGPGPCALGARLNEMLREGATLGRDARGRLGVWKPTSQAC